MIAQIIATGGIGTGVVYRLEGNHTLGREESRMAGLSSQRDFCKQHIVLHYLARLIKEMKLGVSVNPIGAVGEDTSGKTVVKMMREEGMRTRFVRSLPKCKTLHAVCFQYPDGSGGNVTQKDSASDCVLPRQVDEAARALLGKGGKHQKSMIIALPEVPLKSRLRLLSAGRKHNAFNAAAFNSEELAGLRKGNDLSLVDLLALNADEARALAGVSSRVSSKSAARACWAEASRVNPGLQLVVTLGKEGAMGFASGKSQLHKPLSVKAINTAGAGDAFLSGVLLGILRGRPFLSAKDSCLHLGRLLASMSVTSEDTINFEITLDSLRVFGRLKTELFA